MSHENRHRASLVGRSRELAVLEDIVTRARSSGRMAVVGGEAGIGKTRLIQAAMDAASRAGVTVLSSRAEELEAHRPFGAVVDLAGRERLEEHLALWDLAPDTAGSRQFQIAETVLDLLEEVCARGPVLVVVEDIQWADPGTIGVLARVAAGLERLPAALVVSTRPEPRRPELDRLLDVLADRGATRIHLGPLDETALVELLEKLLDARPGVQLIRQAGRASGNPLFVGELVGALLADGAIVRADGFAEVARDAAAPSLPLTILHRLSYLPPDALDVLRLASVLGASFAAADLPLLARRPLSELVPVLLSLQRSGVLGEQNERLVFRHELVRDALYDDMPLSVRRGLHTQLADALRAASEPAERIAEHVLRGAETGDEEAVSRLVRAAAELVGRAPGVAVDLYRQAIALSADPRARRLELLPDIAEALVAAGLLGEGEDACREALALDPASGAAPLRLSLMFLLLRRARAEEAVRVGEAGLAGSRLENDERARLQGLTAMARIFQGQVEPALRDARAVLAVSGDELARALATNTLALAADGRGAFAEADELIAANVAWAERSSARLAHDTRPHMIRSLVLARLDRLDEAYGTIQRGRAGAELLGLADALPVYHYQLALIEFLRGRFDDALVELAAHAQLADETEIGWHLPAESLRALIAIHRDDLLAAERHVAAAEAEAAGAAPSFGLEMMVLARARLLAAGGKVDAALDVIAGTFAALADAGAATFLPALGPELSRIAVAAGRRSAAVGVVPELQRIARLNPGTASLEAGALHAHGLLEADAGSLLEALALMRSTGRVLETAAVAEDAAAILGPPARDLLEEAHGIYERSGATRDLARVDAALRALGVRRGVSGRRHRPAMGWEALTDTELKVVRLVAERLTNPEIAARLFVSRRTVQTHVSHALAKLEVATRRELADEAARHGGWRLRLESGDAEPT